MRFAILNKAERQNKDMKRWEQQRKTGRLKYSIIAGLKWAVLVCLLKPFLDTIIEGTGWAGIFTSQHYFSFIALGSFIFMLLAGIYINYYTTWDYYEKYYARLQKNQLEAG